MPILVPLFISAFRRADELATAMECRCYHGGEGRTKLHVLHYQTRDYLVLGGFIVLVAGSSCWEIRPVKTGRSYAKHRPHLHV